MSAPVRQTALRAGGACVRCRKGKTRCVYENGRAPCRNCAKGMHECFLPTDAHAHVHGQTPTRTVNRPARESLPASANERSSAQHAPRSGGGQPDKLGPEFAAECERVVSKSFPANIVFHKPTFVQQIKNYSTDLSIAYGMMSCAARSSSALIRRYGGSLGATGAAEHFTQKAISRINETMDSPSLADIQAMCLVVIHEWGSRNAVRAYIYLGQAARMLQMYRILNSHQHQPDGDRFLREESFRRTLWLVYVLDCILSSTPGRYPALSAADIVGVALPCTDVNFAFGNAVYVKTIALEDPVGMPAGAPTDEIGEFGHIVLATRIWRNVVHCLTLSSVSNFNEDDLYSLMGEVDRLRASLPMQYVDKPGQISLHITMGSGTTYAMIHCILHCATIFIHRRRLLQYVSLGIDNWRNMPQCHDIIDRLMTSCHTITSMLMALELSSDKDTLLNFPIFMLFATFTASSTVAYLSLKGLTPPSAVETAATIVKDGLHLMDTSVEIWPLISSWSRHLAVMQRVLNNDAAAARSASAGATASANNLTVPHIQRNSPSVKDDAVSNADTNPDAMDYDQNQAVNSDTARGDSEPPMRRTGGIATINGGTSGVPTPGRNSSPNPEPTVERQPTPNTEVKSEPPAPNSASASMDMTSAELCAAFEKQLLELDDLAALMGGGV
ncbi:hypothetical protein BROUX41_004759 [Berkeleyomyces rouxiae]